MGNLNIIQKIVLVVLFSYSLGFAGYNIWAKRVSVLGTGGTVILPVLIVLIILTSRLQFYFTQNYIFQTLGFVIFMAGILFVGWAVKNLGENIDDFWTAKNKPKQRHLVITGPYQKIRHPIYTGMFIHYIGFTIVFFHPVTVSLTVLYFLGMLYTAISEEIFLKNKFPGYNDYINRTGRFFPKILAK